MKVNDLKQAFYDASEKLSDICRPLCFAGIAVVWMLKTKPDENGGIEFSEVLLLPLACFVISLGLDLFQYIYKTLAFYIYYLYKDCKEKTPSADFRIISAVNFPTWLFFGSKIIAILIGYWYLIRYIACKLIA